ncbi:MAG: hypothetical protein PHO48_02430, partial [Candidatus Gracilibacteria bacterium]|nr:hypothetical protein [Candidatus Gracilibacteria bacterium]
MAREPRFKRRFLSERLMEILKTAPLDKRMLRVLPPAEENDPYYVFLLFPIPKFKKPISHDQYRHVRRNFLEACCMVTKLKNPSAKDIVGIATEPGIYNIGRSEDAIYLDARNWNKQLEDEAIELQEKLEILKSPTM